MSIIYINSYQFAAAPPSGYDPDAQAYITAVEAADTAAGSPGGLETAVKDAINAFVVGCKADGIWSAILGSCILAGARTLSGALVPLKGNTPTNNGFLTTDYNRKTGLLGDGLTKRINTGHSSDYNSAQGDNLHASSYITAASPASDREGFVGANFGYELLLIGTSFYPRIGSQAGLIAVTKGTGFVGAASISTTQISWRYAGQSGIVSSNATAQASNPIYVFTRSATDYSASRQAFYSLGYNLNLSLLDTRVTTLINAFASAIP